MFKLDAASTICAIRDAVCPPILSPNPDGSWRGVAFAVQVELAFYHDSDVFRCGRVVYIAMCGNTNVFVAVEPDGARWVFVKDVPLEAWVNTSNHDSCWRTDGLHDLTSVYFAAADSVNVQLERRGLPKVPPVRLHDESRFWMKPWQFVDISHERGPGKVYRRRLTRIAPISPPAAGPTPGRAG